MNSADARRRDGARAAWRSRLPYAVAVAAVLAAGIIVVAMSATPPREDSALVTREQIPVLIDSCLREVRDFEYASAADTPEKKMAVKGWAWSHCYNQILNRLQLNSFNRYAEKYDQQAFASAIVLYLVVTITLSGIGLAALQLLTSYKLAHDGKGASDASEDEIVLEANRLSVKSSIAGVTIIALSFAFFSVFVFGIHKSDRSPEAPAALANAENWISQYRGSGGGLGVISATQAGAPSQVKN